MTVETSSPEETLLSKVKAREKAFSDGWWKHAEQAVELFNYEKADPQNPYNILYSNTEVLKPSLYSATPKPDVRGRWAESPVSPLTKLVERLLIIFSDPGNPGEESLDLAMSDCVTSALTAGLGCIRLRLYENTEGKSFPICPESVHYKGLLWPAGRKWSKLPWIAFRHELTREEFFSLFEIPKERRPLLQIPDPSDLDEERDKNHKPGTVVYEVWVKASKKISFLCEDWEPILIREDSDPLGLAHFFPTPGPLLMTTKPGRLIPTPLYQYYRNQAEELNRVTARLNKILAAIKVRGAYNSLLGSELERMLSDESMENSLVPAAESGLLAQNGGFERQIWLLPIDQLVTVATQLYQARIQIKQVIYEITGLSDIIRGSSVASETATAQNLKNKWGSIRLRDMQKATASYVRDLYRLIVDAASEKLPSEAWKTITQAPFPTAAEKETALQQAQFDASQGRPPQPQILQTLQSPSIEELLSQIKSDANRTYTINIQYDSTVDLDTATSQGDVQEFMGAMAQLLGGLQPLASLGPSGLNAAKEILVAVCSRYKFGLSIVDSLKAIQAPPPAQQDTPSPEQEKKEKDLQQKQSQLDQTLDQIESAKRDLEVQRKEFAAEVKVAQAELSAQQKVFQADQQVKAATLRAQEAQSRAAQATPRKPTGSKPARPQGNP